MPKAIDKDLLESPSMKVLDIGKPPTKDIPYQPYPKMVYLHPKDKTKEHRFKVVDTPEEHAEAEKQGYKTKPHTPVEVAEDLSDDFEAAGSPSLESMTKAQLLAIAKEQGIEVDPTAKKEVILAAIKAESDEDDAA